MSRDASDQAYTKRNEENYLFMIKKYIMKNEKNKSKELKIGNDVPSKFFDICSLLYQSHPLVFSTKVKRRCVDVGGNGRERVSVVNIFFRFSNSFNMFIFEREIKKRGVYVGVVMGKN